MSHNFVNPVDIVDSTDTSKKVRLDPASATTNTTATITTAQLADRTYAVPDSGANASFVMTEGSQTINGTKTFNTSLLIKESSGSDTITIQAPALAASYSLTLPVDDGTSNNEVLTTNGSGVLSWQSFLPAGMLLPFAGSSTPTGFLLCDGSEVSQATYANLFAAIGTTWNTGGEGAGNFRLPNLSRRTLVGSGGAGSGTLGNAVGNIGGAETLPAHDHTAGTLANGTSAVTGSITMNSSSVSGTVGGADGTHGHVIYYKDDVGGGTSNGFDINNTGDDNFLNGSSEGTIGTGLGGGGDDGGHGHSFSLTAAAQTTNNISLTAAAQTISGSTGSTGIGTHGVIQPSAVVTYVIKT